MAVAGWETGALIIESFVKFPAELMGKVAQVSNKHHDDQNPFFDPKRVGSTIVFILFFTGAVLGPLIAIFLACQVIRSAKNGKTKNYV